MLVADRRLVLQLPHQDVDEVRVFDHNGHFFKHMLEANVCLLQTRMKGKRIIIAFCLY